MLYVGIIASQNLQFACGIMIMFMYLIAVSDHKPTMTAGLLQMWRSYYIDTTAVVEVEGIHEIIISGGCSCRVNCIAYDQ